MAHWETNLVEAYSWIFTWTCKLERINTPAIKAYCMYLIVAASPEEDRVHECSDKAAGSRREGSLWRGNHTAAFRHPQWVASLSGVIAEEQGREICCWYQVIMHKICLLACKVFVPQLALQSLAEAYLLASLLPCASFQPTPPMVAPHTLHVLCTTTSPHCTMTYNNLKLANYDKIVKPLTSPTK